MKILRMIYFVFIGFLAITTLLLIVSVFPISGNYKLLVVQSGSMEPAIKMGGVVITKPQGDYKIGEIITFGPYSKTKPPITHRIQDIKIASGEPIYITKGDANNAPDAREIAKKDIVGKVLFSVPYVGYAIDFVKKPVGFMLIIVIPATIIIYEEIRKICQEIKSKKISKKSKNV